MVWYSHLFKNFPEFVVIYTGNKGNIFLEFSCFFYDPSDASNLISGSSAFSKSSLNIWKFSENFEHWRILSITFLACEMSAIVW